MVMVAAIAVGVVMEVVAAMVATFSLFVLLFETDLCSISIGSDRKKTVVWAVAVVARYSFCQKTPFLFV